jgi:hypothetical protein
MGQHVLCVIEVDVDNPDQRREFEVVMDDLDWSLVDGMNAFYRRFDDEVTDDQALEHTQRALKTAARIAGLEVPEAVLAIA